MKEPWEWEESDLLDMILNQKEESINLDYKRSDALGKTGTQKTEISKDVSALANSDGGILVYGIIESGHVPTGLDKGCDPSDISREWLENVITSNIRPKINGLKIKPILLNSHAPGRVAYVVHVPQSTTAHMAADYRYYKRYNFKSQPMADYEVRDVMRRAETPDINVEFNFGRDTNPHIAQGKTRRILNGYLTNEANVPAEYVRIILYIDSQIETFVHPASQLITTQGALLYGKIVQQVQIISQNRIVPTHLPIWKGMRLLMFNPGLQLTIPESSTYPFFLGYEIHSPGMLPKIVVRQIRYEPSYGVGFSDKTEYLESPFGII